MAKIKEGFHKTSRKTSRSREDRVKGNTLKRSAKSGPLQLHHLPDDILRRILSRLTFRESSRMGLLSRKWRRLWRTCCSKVIFTRATMFQLGNTSIRPTRTNFARQVNSLLRQLYSPLALNKFIVKFGLRKEHSCRVDKWVRFCAASWARHIVFDFSPGAKGKHSGFADSKYIFPLDVFSSTNNSFAHVISLHLGYVCLDTTTASFAGLAKLKKLTLHKVSILGDRLCLMLHKCTALEWLSISCCPLPALTSYQPLHRLRYLRLHYCYLSMIKLEAPNLTTFDLTNRPIPFALGDTRMVEEANINLLYNGTSGDNLDYIYSKLPASLACVQKLSITSELYIFDELQGFAKTSARFMYLSHLTLSLPLTGDHWSIGGILRLIYLLELAPIIEQLELHFYWHGTSRRQALKENRENMVSYRHDKLKRVVMSGACHWVGMIELAYYILRSASRLECMIMDPVNRIQGPRVEGWKLDIGRQMAKTLLERKEFQGILTVL